MQRSRRVALVLLAVCLLAAGALANDLETHLSIICRPPDGFCQLTDEGIPDRPAMVTPRSQTRHGAFSSSLLSPFHIPIMTPNIWLLSVPVERFK